MATSDHYFSAGPESASEPVEIECEVRGVPLRLHSDRGVFSRTHPDPGTLLLARTAVLPPQGTILDLGCGYGVLGLVAAISCPGARVTLVDVNARAAALAQANCERYHLGNTEVLCGDARSVLTDRRYDTVLCNPPYRAGKATVMSLLEDAAHRLTPAGALWIVGRTKQGIKTLARDLTPLFDQVRTVEIKAGYRVIRCAVAQGQGEPGAH